MNTNSISIEYSDSELRNLVEEYITQQKSEFTLKCVCSYILYWAVEDGKVVEGENLLESGEMQTSDQDRVKRFLETIIADGRIATASDCESKYVKQ